MNIALLIIAAIFAGVGALLLWQRAKAASEIALMAKTATTDAADIATVAEGTLVELKGPLRCDALITGEFSQKPCVYYKATVEREYETTSRDSKGRTEHTRHRETVSSNERNAPCVLEDASGKVAIYIDGATVEGIESHKRFEPAGASIGDVAQVVGSLIGLSGGSRDIGMHYTETMIPADVPVYVLGTVRSDHAVGSWPDKKHPFVISHKSEEERTKDLRSSMLWLMIGAIACFAAALGFLYWAWSQRTTAPAPEPQKKAVVEWRIMV